MNILIDGQTFETPEIHRGIGVYTKNVINNMLKQNYEHVWYIAVSDESNLCELDSWVRAKIHVKKNSALAPSTDYKRNAAYTTTLKKLIEELHIDLLWIPNMLMVNVLAPVDKLPCRVCVTVYDIIPYLFPIHEWGREIKTEYFRRLHYLTENQNIEVLYISNATKVDFEKNIGRVHKSCVAVLAADSHKFYQKRESKQKSEYTILFTGGFDYRKNIDGAIDAFAEAMNKFGSDTEFAKCKLVIVGSCSPEVKQKYYEKIRTLKIEDKVQLTGYVSDKQLAELYKTSEVFFFPSLYEGFGLPILEAMLGGCYIVSADNSSLPEVCAGRALLCNAENIDNMANALYEGFRNSITESIEEKNCRQEYALEYTWERTAWDTLEFWRTDIIEGDNQIKKEKLAIVTPWPMMETGIANYVYKMVPYLDKYYQITIYSEVSSNECKTLNEVNICNLNEFEENIGNYDHVLYEIGNNVEFHKNIYELLEKHGGVAEIHDYILTPFFYHSYFLSGERGKFKELLQIGYGQDGVNIYEICEQLKQQPDMKVYPMSEVVVKKAKKTIFHNHWSAEQLEQERVGVIPHACFDKESLDEQEKIDLTEKLKKKYEIKEEIVVGCFGWVNENKRPQVVIQAVQELHIKGYKVKLIFWGKSNSQVLDLIKEKHAERYISVSGYLDKKEYEMALQLTDIVVNLRYPSMGESSGTLSEALKYGKPVIVSQLNQYKEYPDEVCWKVPVCRQEEEILTKYLEYLIENPEVREILGNNARNYAEEVLNPERVARMYYDFL